MNSGLMKTYLYLHISYCTEQKNKRIHIVLPMFKLKYPPASKVICTYIYAFLDILQDSLIDLCLENNYLIANLGGVVVNTVKVRKIDLLLISSSLSFSQSPSFS
jgi:hypothetical protein